MADSVQIDTKGLDKLIRTFGNKVPTTRIGVLGNHATRSGVSQDKTGKFHKTSKNNAEVGAAHEFGSVQRGLPARSFLRMPLALMLQKTLEKSKAFDEAALKKIMAEGSLETWVKKVAVVALDVVLEAFKTKGFGHWRPWRKAGYSNQAGDLLQDTVQLKKSITWDVK